MFRKNIRIAAFGFRSLPPVDGSAGADKFALELFPRLVKLGHQVTAYNRIYPNQKEIFKEYEDIHLINIKTVSKSGFDTIIHSFLSTLHIIIFNTGNIIHIQNGGNSIWAFILRLFGKKVVLSQDGIDWKRDKWSWYGKLYLFLSSLITAYIPNRVIFDNVFVKRIFESKYHKKYDFIPFGSETFPFKNSNILTRLKLDKYDYFLFIGRFIPDKGLHYLIPAFIKTNTSKKLVLVGGSPNSSNYEKVIKSYKDKRLVFPGFQYGNDVNTLIKYCYCYIQPSDIEGLSPVILQVMGVGRPIICSDIQENIFVVQNTAISFKKSDINDLSDKLKYSLNHNSLLEKMAVKCKKRALKYFNWDKVTEDHIKIFQELSSV